ncbi:acyltransferase family protein [Rhodobacteraceae bacterium 2CG4]|uniref:Acyltransferase family protein n=1 Tax=Halovulum marinum TaxID=2662447 RepID=A0A6L5YYV3_9RHOB|nr:acyltransferase family protein [Halovulum marinum]MSU89090.1 acyltransferase family protein [Halovulum marinum]
MNHRPDIDGLRAVAVLPVILFHAGFSWAAGGFVGVDVFFVISGYLITRLLLQDLAQGRYSLTRFYERRARRILPALLFVTAATVPLMMQVMTPEELEDHFAAVIATAAFASNLWFWQEAGYFAARAEELPLLHTWSLAIEEQFYVLFPLLLAALWRLGPRRTGLALGGLLLLSFAIAAGGVGGSEARFYLLPARAWELLAGALCALWHHRYGARADGRRAALGLLAITVSIAISHPGLAWPSQYTLLPVGGTALLLLHAEGTAAGRLLSARPLVGIGLISYSAYLWHQPLLAALRLSDARPPSEAMLLAAAALALLLGWATWRLVEQPFRRRRGGDPAPPVRAAAAALAVTALAAGIAAPQVDRLSRFPRQPDFGWEDAVRQYDCMLQEKNETTHADVCYAPPSVLLWGDSHAAALYPGLRAAAARRGLPVTQLTQAGCPPLLDLDPAILNHRPNCNAVNARILEHVRQTPYRLIVLHAGWRHWGYPMDDAAFDAALARTVQVLSQAAGDARVVVVGPVPRWYPTAFKQFILTREYRPETLSARGDALYADAYLMAGRNRALARGLAGSGFAYVDPADSFCPAGDGPRRCLITFDGTATGLVSVDNDHLSPRAAEWFAERALAPHLAAAAD